jgi:hypothetical protein
MESRVDTRARWRIEESSGMGSALTVLALGVNKTLFPCSGPGLPKL